MRVCLIKLAMLGPGTATMQRQYIMGGRGRARSLGGDNGNLSGPTLHHGRQPRPAIDNVIMEPAEITQAPTHPLSSEQGMSGRLPVYQLLIMF